MDWTSFNSFQVDAIREVVNIGSGNAATALSEMIGRTVDMDVPVAEVVSIYEMSGYYGTPEETAYAVLVRSEGDVPCNLVFLISDEDADFIAHILVDKRFGELDEESLFLIRESSLSETGNIILGAFLRALSSMTGLSLSMSVPSLAHDMVGSIMDVVAALMGEMGDFGLLVKTSLHITDGEECEKGRHIQGAVVMIPDKGSMETLLTHLGVL